MFYLVNLKLEENCTSTLNLFQEYHSQDENDSYKYEKTFEYDLLTNFAD